MYNGCMEIKLTKEIEDFLDRCRYNIYNDTKNEFVGLHVTTAEEKANNDKIDTNDSGKDFSFDIKVTGTQVNPQE